MISIFQIIIVEAIYCVVTSMYVISFTLCKNIWVYVYKVHWCLEERLASSSCQGRESFQEDAVMQYQRGTDIRD